MNRSRVIVLPGGLAAATIPVDASAALGAAGRRPPVPVMDVESLPDPGPECLADVRLCVGLIGQPAREVAEMLNEVCRVRWITGPMVQLWLSGRDDPPQRVARALLWLSGFPVGGLAVLAAGH